MAQEQQLALALIERNLTLTQWMDGVRVAEKVREKNIPSKEIPQLVETASELRDPELRQSAYATLELMKETGKSLKEAGAYVEELGSQIATMEKQILNLDERTRRAKAEFSEWEQKRKDEKAKFEQDRRKLNEELRQRNVVRENVEKTVSHEAQLKSIGLDLQTFDSIAAEVIQGIGINPGVGQKIREDIKRAGSLYKAIAEKEKEERSRKEAVSNLSKEESEKKETLRQLDNQISIKRRRIKEQNDQINENQKRIEASRWQYEFFECFISMLLNSPAAKSSLFSLDVKLQELEKRGWAHSTDTSSEERRSLFVTGVMGFYLRSIHCERCGASFIVNRDCNAYFQYENSYYCPVCHSNEFTKPDDTFLNLMVSPDLVRSFQNVRKAIEFFREKGEVYLKKVTMIADAIPDEVIKSLPQG